MNITRGIIAGAGAGFTTSICFFIINLISNSMFLHKHHSLIYSFDTQSIPLIIIFELSCVGLGILCSVFYIILYAKKLHKNQENSNIIKDLVILLSFAFGISMLSSTIFNHQAVWTAGVSAGLYYYLLEVFLGKRKFEGWFGEGGYIRT